MECKTSTPIRITDSRPRPAMVIAAGGRLSRRELQVLQLVAQATSNKAIARQLQLSVHTVKRHVARMLERIGAASRAEAAALYRSVWLAQVNRAVAPVEEFTAREREVAALLVAGRSNVEIAEELSLSPNTVKGHTATIMQKLGAQNR